MRSGYFGRQTIFNNEQDICMSHQKSTAGYMRVNAQLVAAFQIFYNRRQMPFYHCQIFTLQCNLSINTSR